MKLHQTIEIDDDFFEENRAEIFEHYFNDADMMATENIERAVEAYKKHETFFEVTFLLTQSLSSDSYGGDVDTSCETSDYLKLKKLKNEIVEKMNEIENTIKFCEQTFKRE